MTMVFFTIPYSSIELATARGRVHGTRTATMAEPAVPPADDVQREARVLSQSRVRIKARPKGAVLVAKGGIQVGCGPKRPSLLAELASAACPSLAAAVHWQLTRRPDAAPCWSGGMADASDLKSEGPQVP